MVDLSADVVCSLLRQSNVYSGQWLSCWWSNDSIPADQLKTDTYIVFVPIVYTNIGTFEYMNISTFLYENQLYKNLDTKSGQIWYMSQF